MVNLKDQREIFNSILENMDEYEVEMQEIYGKTAYAVMIESFIEFMAIRCNSKDDLEEMTKEFIKSIIDNYYNL